MIIDTELEKPTPFVLGDWYIDPEPGEISAYGSDAESNRIEPQVMSVLLCLAAQANNVVSRETIEAEVWSDRVVGYDSLSTAIIKLRKALGDNSKNPRYIETVHKKGYRLIMPISPPSDMETIAIEPAEATTENQLNDTSHRTRPRRLNGLRLAGLGVLIAVTSIVLINQEYRWFFKTRIAPNSTIAVLPFENMSTDVQQDYFSDGITSDIITDLSKISGLGVIARNSVFSYKDSSADPIQIGRELGAAYLIQGSVRKSNHQLRITAHLMDISNGRDIWAERFDGSLEDVFALQDKVTARIIDALQLKISDRERGHIAKKYTESIEAYDNFLKGWGLYWEYSKESNKAAREFFIKAIDLDPDFARAYANLALTHAADVMNGWTKTPMLSLDKAEALSQQALELDSSLSQVHWAVAFSALVNRKYQLALSESIKAIDLDPNNADGYGILATTLNYTARPKEALEQMKKAMLLNPYHPSVYKIIMGEIYFNLRDYENAIKQFEAALNRNPEAQEARLWMTSTYAHLGRIDDANWELEQIKINDPSVSIDTVAEAVPFIDPLQLRHLIDGLYKAGLR
ncbi:MAG: winged helix-turn-helix domain-containing protein [Gammaproteobacteria bacterium]|nr:winged helix-turn-helix domain-containing protein [Gammaproteobacteria bacterium]